MTSRPEPAMPAGAPPEDEAAPQSLNEIGERVIALLTRAARMRQPRHVPAAAGEATATEAIDFGGFLVPILAAVAANRGGTDALLEGRPGSWEADKLRALLLGAGCYYQDQLCRYRTEPIVIDVPIEYIVLDSGRTVPNPDHPGRWLWRTHHDGALLPESDINYDEQINALELERGNRIEALEGRHEGEDYDLWSEEAEQLEADFDSRRAEAHRTWTTRYSRYLDAFRANVLAQAAVIGLDGVAIEVRGETDPERSWDAARAGGDLWDSDALAAQLYEHALEVTPRGFLFDTAFEVPPAR